MSISVCDAHEVQVVVLCKVLPEQKTTDKDLVDTAD